MSLNKPIAIVTILLVLLASAAVLGCTSSGQSDNVTPTPTTAPTAAPTAQPTTAPAAAPTAAPAVAPTVKVSATPTPYPWGNLTYDYHWSNSGPVVLTVDGNVTNVLQLSMGELKSLGVMHVNYSLNSHGTITYIDCDAVPLSTLLARAKPLPGATRIKFYCGLDGFSKTIPLVNVTSDSRTVVGLTSNQGLRNLMPNEGPGVWVQNLSVITII